MLERYTAVEACNHFFLKNLMINLLGLINRITLSKSHSLTECSLGWGVGKMGFRKREKKKILFYFPSLKNVAKLPSFHSTSKIIAVVGCRMLGRSHAQVGFLIIAVLLGC